MWIHGGREGGSDGIEESSVASLSHELLSWRLRRELADGEFGSSFIEREAHCV